MESFPDVRELDIFPVMESETLEFKETWSTNSRSTATKAICSFLNAKGGTVVFGVEDKERKIVGLSATSTEIDNRIRWVDDFYHKKGITDQEGNQIQPGVLRAEVIPLKDGKKHLFAVHVKPVPGKLYKTVKGEAWYRLNASVLRLQETSAEKQREYDQAIVDSAVKRAELAEQELALQKARADVLLKDAMAWTTRLREKEAELEAIRKDTKVILGAAKDLEGKMERLGSALRQDILERKERVEQELAAQRRSWWQCFC